MKNSMTNIILLVGLILAASAFSAGHAVYIGQTELFKIEHPAGGMTALERSRKVQTAVERIMEDPTASTDSIIIRDLDSLVAIDFERSRLFTIYPVDTTGKGISLVELAERWRAKIIVGIEAERKRSISAGNLAKLGLGVLFPFLVIILYLLIHRAYSGLCKGTVKREGSLFKGIRIRDVEIMPPKLQVSIILKILLFLKWLFLILIYYAMILLFFYLFPATESYAQAILEASLHWLKNVGNVLVDVAKFLLMGIFFYILARILWGLSDMVFRHYESPSTITKIPDEALGPLRRLTKGIIAFAFAILLVAAVPGPGEYFALVLLSASFIVVAAAALPFILSGIVGLSFLVMRKIKVGDVVSVGGKLGRIITIGMIWTTIEDENNDELFILNNKLVSDELICKSREKKSESE